MTLLDLTTLMVLDAVNHATWSVGFGCGMVVGLVVGLLLRRRS